MSVIDLLVAHSLDIKGMSSKLGLRLTHRDGGTTGPTLAKRAVLHITQPFEVRAVENPDEAIRPGTRYDLKFASLGGETLHLWVLDGRFHRGTTSWTDAGIFWGCVGTEHCNDL